jgi:hypothetical protein
MQVVILKQPLYGSVEWNGIDFIYKSYTVENYNDFYIYSITQNGKTTVYNKYVNLDNIAPAITTNNLTLTAEANGVNVINISSLATDTTNPFYSYKIKDITGALYGTAVTDGDNIYYISNAYNSVEVLTYTITDKEYESTGTLTLSVINGIVLDTSPKGLSLLYISRSKLEQLKPLSGNWKSLVQIVNQNKEYWNSIDYVRYNQIWNIVDTNNLSWTDIYDYKPVLIDFVTTLSSNSATWVSNEIDGNDIYDIINPKTQDWDTAYLLLSAISGSVNSFDSLSTEINEEKPKLDNLYQVVNDNKDTLWDTTELYNISSNYFDFWNQMLSSINVGLWDSTNSILTGLSANLNQYTGIFDDLYNLINANSASITNNTYLSSLSSEYFGLWDNVVSILSANSQGWNNLNQSVTSLSADYYNKIPYYDSLYNTITANIGVVWSTITLDYLNKHNYSYSIVESSSASWAVNDIFSNDFTKYNSYHQTATQNLYSKWVPDTLNKILTSDSLNWDNTYNTVSSLSDKFDFDNSRYSLNFFNNLTANSSNWNDSYNLINLSSNNWNISNDVSSVSSKYLSGDFYTPLTVNNLTVNNVLSTGGTFFIAGELKKIDTVIVTAETFIVYNESTNDALTVDKIGSYGSIATFKNSVTSSNVLSIDSNHSVGINLSHLPTESLTVSGNISASGYMYPYLSDTINTYKVLSSKYENIYNSLASGSATSIANLTSDKIKYDSLVQYQNLSADNINNLLSTNYINYGNLYNTVFAQSAKNIIVKNFLELSATSVDIDPEFANHKFKYDGLYNFYLNSQ